MEYTVFSFLLITFTGAAVYSLCLFILRDRFFLENAKIVIGNVKKVFLKIFSRKKQFVEETGTKEDFVFEEIKEDNTVDMNHKESKDV